MKPFLVPTVALGVAALALAVGPVPSFPVIRNGPYPGPATYILGSGGPGPDIGNVTTTFRTARNQRTLSMRVSGIVDPDDTPVPIDASLRFTRRNRQVTANSFLLGYQGPTATQRARYRPRGRTLRFTLRAVPGAAILGTPIDGAVAYQLTLRRRQFSLAGVGSLAEVPAGTPLPFSVAITGTR